MEDSSTKVEKLTTTAGQLVRQLMTVGENRVELLVAEVQEERGNLLRALLLVLGVAVCGLLAGISLTAAIVILFWSYSPLGVLIAITALYAVAGVGLYRRLALLQSQWQPLAASRDQLRKDRVCLEKLLSLTRSNRGNAF